MTHHTPGEVMSHRKVPAWLVIASLAIAGYVAPVAMARPTDAPPANDGSIAIATQDKRSPDAADPPRPPARPVPGPPTWPKDPQPIVNVQGGARAPASADSDGSGRLVPLLAIAGAALLFGGGLAIRIRQRTPHGAQAAS
jgi:hypothetical protein